jgi:pimeloyl-ACP methyl ester carboxylesterase
MWKDFSDSLKNKFTTICIDLPGFGKSDIFNSEHSMVFMAEKAHQVLEQENIKKCTLIGHSMGGYVSLAFAKRYPGSLSGLVLFHSQAAADNMEGKKNRDRTIEVIKNNHKGFIYSFIPSLFAEDNMERFSGEIDELIHIAENIENEGIIAALKGMRNREDHFNTLKKLNVPVYFIIGKQDSRIPLDSIMPQLELPSNSEALIIDDVGHMGFIEAKEKTLLALEHFIERNLN